jgi:hypothetical protein
MAAIATSAMSLGGHSHAAEEMVDVRPTKLFIGGISRHTTTKLLRDHFASYGRVLDCVAMRQPDGRSRGFGLVTLDSLAAAERCLAEPMVIDGRVLDMKMAVPEPKTSGGKSSWAPTRVSPGVQSTCLHPALAWCLEAPAFVPQVAKTPEVLSASAPEFVPQAMAAQPRAVLAKAEEDLLVYAEDYVSFLEDQQRLCSFKKKMSASDAKKVPRSSPPAEAPPPPPALASTDSDISTCASLKSLAEEEAMMSAGSEQEADLPSAGSALHASGECRPCNFFPKGRCSAALDCTFCHLSHDKRKPTRQEVRERRLAWQQRQEEESKKEESSDKVPVDDAVALTEILMELKPSRQEKREQLKESPAPLAAVKGVPMPPRAFQSAPRNSASESLPPAAASAAPAPFAMAFNFADYDFGDDDSDSEDEASPEQGSTTATHDATGADVETTQEPTGCQWSREEMLRLRVAMSNARAADIVLPVSC